MPQQPAPSQFHYDLIAEALRMIEEDASAQPSLDDVARRIVDGLVAGERELSSTQFA